MSKITKQGFLGRLFSAVRPKRTSPTRPIGVGGSRVFGGHLDEQESDSSLTGEARYKTFSNMLANTPTIGAGVHIFVNLLGKAGWSFEPADDSAKAQQIAEDIEFLMTEVPKTSWRRVVRRAGMSRMHGFSFQEWIAKRLDDGRIGYDDIKPRPQRTIELWDIEDDELFGIVQRHPVTSEEFYIPRARLLYVVDDTINDSPNGLGLFRQMVDTWRRLKRYEQLEGSGFETDLQGIPLGRAPLAMLDEMIEKGVSDSGNPFTEADKTRYLAGLNSFLQNHIRNPELGLLLDSDVYESLDESGTPSGNRKWDLEVITGGATAFDAIHNTIVRLQHELARLMGTEGMLLGSTSAGSFALSDDKSHTLAQLITSVLLDVCESVDRDLVMPLMRLNGWPEDLAPTCKVDAIEQRDVQKVAATLRDLNLSGLGREDEAYGQIFDLLGLVRPSPDDLELEIPNLMGPPQEGDIDQEDSEDDPKNPDDVDPDDGNDDDDDE